MDLMPFDFTDMPDSHYGDGEEFLIPVLPDVTNDDEIMEEDEDEDVPASAFVVAALGFDPDELDNE